MTRRPPPRQEPRQHHNKYCKSCGRLISPSHASYAERTHCGRSCSSTRLTALDREIEAAFVRLSGERGVVSAGEVEELFRDDAEVDGTGRGGEDATTGGGKEQRERQRSGMRRAEFRERVRRAGRRVVVFSSGLSGDGEGKGEETGVGGRGRFECVQDGKVVEGSFAKGEWGIRFIPE